MTIGFLFLLLGLLIVLSGFFSGSETGIMSLNRYRLEYLASQGHRSAKILQKLLSRPDRLLGVILIGNTFANVFASAIATVIVVRYFGGVGLVFATVLLTLIILIFAEMIPKTTAALHPQRIAFPAAFPLRILLTVFYPLVWLAGGVANAVLRLFRINVKKKPLLDALSREELRAVVYAAGGRITPNYQQMLLRILDLEKVTVNDIMVPREDIDGVDLDMAWPDIVAVLKACRYTRLIAYRNNKNAVEGVLHLRKALPALLQGEEGRALLEKKLEAVHFIPERTLLSVQMSNFQNDQYRIGLVVDEYGEMQGLVTLEDILEEIIGEFTADLAGENKSIQFQKGGVCVVAGNITIRELNRLTGWNLPASGAKTLSGLVIEYLKSIPESGVGVRIAGYPIEVLEVSENRITKVKVYPALRRENKA